MPAETSQTLHRGLRVLEILSDRPAGVSVSSLARELGIARTIVYRLVVTLEQHRLVRRGTDGRCRLGVAALAFGRDVQPVVRASAVPTLRRLAEHVGATAHLTLVDGSEAITIAVVEPTRTDLHVALREGSRTSLERGIAGRAAVAPRRSQRATQPGWVIAGTDPTHGGYGIAAPLEAGTGVEGSVGVVSMVGLDPAIIGPKVVAAAQEISRLLADRGGDSAASDPQTTVAGAEPIGLVPTPGAAGRPGPRGEHDGPGPHRPVGRIAAPA